METTNLTILLNEIEAAHKLLCAQHSNKRAMELLKVASSKIDMEDARDIGSGIQVRNIKKIAGDLSMYNGIIDMLLSNLNDDIQTTRRNLVLVQQKRIEIMHQNSIIQKENERREKDAKRKRTKRHSI